MLSPDNLRGYRVVYARSYPKSPIMFSQLSTPHAEDGDSGEMDSTGGSSTSGGVEDGSGETMVMEIESSRKLTEPDLPQGPATRHSHGCGLVNHSPEITNGVAFAQSNGIRSTIISTAPNRGDCHDSSLIVIPSELDGRSAGTARESMAPSTVKCNSPQGGKKNRETPIPINRLPHRRSAARRSSRAPSWLLSTPTIAPSSSPPGSHQNGLAITRPATVSDVLPAFSRKYLSAPSIGSDQEDSDSVLASDDALTHTSALNTRNFYILGPQQLLSAVQHDPKKSVSFANEVLLVNFRPDSAIYPKADMDTIVVDVHPSRSVGLPDSYPPFEATDMWHRGFQPPGETSLGKTPSQS
jgi:hypothetical protein